MRGWVIGTLGVIGGALFVFAAIPLGMSRAASGIVGIAISLAGFATQLNSAFKMRSDFERERKERDAAHQVLMQEVSKLPPKEAINRLLLS